MRPHKPTPLSPVPWLLFILFCPHLLQAQPSPEMALTRAEQDWLAERHTVRVRIGEHPPWEINNPEPQGMAVDNLRIIGSLFDIDFQFVAATDDWDEGFADMAGPHRHYDLLPAAKRTDARLATLAMSQDYLSSPWMIFTRKDRHDLRALSDLRGKTVAVERGYVMHDLLATTEPAIVLDVQDSTKNALLAVSTGRADAYVGNLLVADYLLQAQGIVNLAVAGPTPFGGHKQAMVTRKEWAPLISLIDKGLRAIPAEQQIAIRQHWLASVADGALQAPLDLSDAERAWIAAHPRFRVGAYPLPPWIQQQNGRVDGYLVELMQAIAARAGLRADFDFLTLAEVKAGTEQGTLDATLAVNPTPERGKVLFFSQGSVDFTLSIFARKEVRDITDTASLAGKTLATYAGYSWNARFPAYLPRTRIITAADSEGMLRMVAVGEADAAINETESGKVLLRRALLTNVEPKGFAVFDGRRSYRGHYFGVGRRLPLLASILDKAYAALPDADKQRIWNRWFVPETGSGRVDLNAEERAYLDAARFRRALAVSWMPFDFPDADGAPTGVAEDYWALIRDKLDLHEVPGERLAFTDILAAIERGEIDLYAATTRTADREPYALFSDPYERYPIAIAAAADAGLYAGTASLMGRRVAVGRDYSAYHLLAARAPGIHFVPVENTRTALEAVVDDRADAAVDILPVLHRHIEGFPPGRVKLVGVTDVEFPLQVMVGRRNAALLPLIDRAIAAITPDERAAIHNNWLLRQVVTAPDYSLLWQVLGTALLILTTILYWNHRLHREVARRKRAEADLLLAKDAADRASRAKGDFLANMSHELRTPLNAVIGLARLSLETDPKPPLREYLSKIDLAARTLLALISDILDLSRIEADKLTPRREPFALAAVLERVRVMVERQAADKGLALRINGPAQGVGTLLGDELRLTQVLLNLLGNAVKFTPAGSVTLAVTVAGEDPRGLGLAFAVTDTGIGIPADRRAELFEAFAQLDTANTREHGGSGLGLAISARLVALMGGRLDLDSVVGEGSRFRFRLVFPRTTAPAPRLAVSAPVDLHGIRVLAAEDDSVSQLLVRDLLERRGAAVTLVANGAEAVAAATKGGFDLVLMDIRMPRMDGLEAARRIRALPQGDLPIIALTANALAGERERCLAAGMDGYITKPLEPEALDAELAHQLGLPAAATEAPPPAPAVAVPPGFDAAKVRRWLHQSPDAWRAMLRLFLTEHQRGIAEIGIALDADDRPRANHLLHRLRGAAGALGAADLTAATEHLERALAGDGPVAADARAQFFASAEATLAALPALTPPAREPAPAEPGDEDRGRRLRDLAALLEAGNTRALGHLPWLERWVATEAPEAVRELTRQIDALDFPAALETLRGLEDGCFSA